MIMDNANENNFFVFFNDKLLGKALRKTRKFFAKDFAKISAIMAVCFSIALWITRSLGYFYMLGRFSVYHIAKDYIDVWSDGFWIQVIQSASTCILFLVVNYIYFQLSIPKEKNAKRRIKKFGFVLLEFIVLSVWIFYTNKISVIGLLKELPDTSAVEITALVIVWGLVLIMINAFGIEATFFYKRSIKEKKVILEDKNEVKTQLEKKVENKKKKHKKQNDKEKSNAKQSDKKYQRWIKAIGILLITCIAEFIYMYLVGIGVEKQRNDFKFVVEETTTVEGDEYVFTDQNKGTSYYLYPIIYENQDVYILSQIGKKEDGLIINYDFLKVIDKEGVSTYYLDNLKIENSF